MPRSARPAPSVGLMAKKDRDLIQEAHEYVANLPDESVDGRLTDDAGEPADIDAWADEEARQQDTLKPNRPDQG